MTFCTYCEKEIYLTCFKVGKLSLCQSCNTKLKNFLNKELSINLMKQILGIEIFLRDSFTPNSRVFVEGYGIG